MVLPVLLLFDSFQGQTRANEKATKKAPNLVDLGPERTSTNVLKHFNGAEVGVELVFIALYY